MKPGNVSSIVRQLDASDYVESIKDPWERGVVQVILTQVLLQAASEDGDLSADLDLLFLVRAVHAAAARKVVFRRLLDNPEGVESDWP